MSHALYNLQWQKAMEALSRLINEENPPPRFEDRKPAAVRLSSRSMHAQPLHSQ